MRRYYVCFVVLIILMSSLTKSDNSVNLKVLNQVDELIQVFWINMFSAEHKLVPQTSTPLRKNSEAKITTFRGHTFCVRLANHIPEVEVNFSVGDHDETILVYREPATGDLRIERRDAMTDFQEYLVGVIENCKVIHPFPMYKSQLLSCVKDGLYEEMLRVTTSINLMEAFRNDMSTRLTDYLCNDESLNSTESIDRYNFVHDNETFHVQVLLDLAAAKIWYVEDFLSADDCDILAREGFPTLEAAGTTDEQGENIMTNERIAEQGRYMFDEDNMRSQELWPLYHRALTLVNQHAGLNLQAEGQEGITIVRYDVGGQYRPHCDGSCDGERALDYGRVATGIFYCEVATKGGGTAFPKANIFVKPKKHMAVFFSYVSPDGILDSGLTEHAGCPVLEGNKWIATTWLRQGVGKDHSCEGFDPTGLMFLSDQVAKSRDQLYAKGYSEKPRIDDRPEPRDEL